MSRWKPGWLLFVLMLSGGLTATAQEGVRPLHERYDVFVHAIDGDTELPRDVRLARWTALYGELFPASEFHHLDTLDDRNLDAAFWAAVNAVRLIGQPAYVLQARLAFDELEARQMATTRHYRYMQGAYVQTRMLGEARRFNDRHPSVGLDPIPAIHEPEALQPGSPTEMAVSADGRSLIHRSVDITSPFEIVVVAHPRCHFSRDAMLAIEADPTLAAALQDAKWLIPPDLRFDMDAVERWNQAHPQMALAHAYKVEEWPQLDYWGTPTFYFFKDGTLQTKVTGWPKGGRREELLAALRDVGMLSAGD